MSTFNSLSDRALDLANQVGDNFKQIVPHAGKWMETGAKFGALKTGARVATVFVRRNPVIAIATAAGAGLLWYAAKHRAKQASNNGNGEAIEGSAKRVDARRGNGDASSRRETAAARKRTRASNKKTSDNSHTAD